MNESYYPLNKKQIRSAIFWDALENNSLKTTKCDKGHIHWPPRSMCNICYSNNLEWIDLPLKGKLISWTEVSAPPPGFPSQYIVALVELKDENIRIFGRIDRTDIKSLKKGITMDIIFQEDNGNKFFVFKSTEN